METPYVKDRLPWQSLSPESSFHPPCSHKEKARWTLAEKSSRRHARRTLALLALCRDCSRRWPHRCVSGKSGISRLVVGFRWWKLSPVQWLSPSGSGLLAEQSVLQAQGGCGLLSEGLWWPVQIMQHLLGCNSRGGTLGQHTLEGTCDSGDPPEAHLGVDVVKSEPAKDNLPNKTPWKR